MDAGDTSAFEEFAQGQMMALFGTAYLLVGDVHQARTCSSRRWRRPFASGAASRPWSIPRPTFAR
jgi:hypothetical protein